MGRREGIVATIALALSSLALAGMLNTDAYSQAAKSEATGLDALISQVGGRGILRATPAESGKAVQ